MNMREPKNKHEKNFTIDINNKRLLQNHIKMKPSILYDAINDTLIRPFQMY